MAALVCKQYQLSITGMSLSVAHLISQCILFFVSRDIAIVWFAMGKSVACDVIWVKTGSHYSRRSVNFHDKHDLLYIYVNEVCGLSAYFQMHVLLQTLTMWNHRAWYRATVMVLALNWTFSQLNWVSVIQFALSYFDVMKRKLIVGLQECRTRKIAFNAYLKIKHRIVTIDKIWNYRIQWINWPSLQIDCTKLKYVERKIIFYGRLSNWRAKLIFSLYTCKYICG